MRAALVFRPDVFLVPIDDHLVAVGVGGRDEEEDDVAEDLLGVVGRLAGDEVVGQLHGHLGGADLGRVEAAGDQDDGLALLGQRLGLLGGASARGSRSLWTISRQRSSLARLSSVEMTAMIIGFFSVVSPIVKSLSIGDSRGQLLEVGLDLAVIGQLLVGADLGSRGTCRAASGR